MIYDINLIPKYKAKTMGSYNAVLLLSAAAVTVLLIMFGFYFPYQQKLQLEAQIKDQNSMLLDFSDTEATFTDLQSRLEEINTTDLMMDTIKGSNLKLSEVLNNIESTMPESVIIKTMTLEAGTLTIDGTSPSYTEIAEFIVNLRKADNVAEISFLSAQAGTLTGAADTLTDSGEERLFDFTVYVKYNTADALAGLLTAQVITENSEEQEAVPDETD